MWRTEMGAHFGELEFVDFGMASSSLGGLVAVLIWMVVALLLLCLRCDYRMAMRPTSISF